MHVADASKWAINSVWRCMLYLRSVRLLRLLCCSDVDTDIYDLNGKLTRAASVPVTNDPVMLRAFRDEISRHIIEEAQRLHPTAITFSFNADIQEVDLHAQTVHVAQQDSPKKTVSPVFALTYCSQSCLQCCGTELSEVLLCMYANCVRRCMQLCHCSSASRSSLHTIHYVHFECRYTTIS